MKDYVLVIHTGYKDDTTNQISVREERSLLFVKSQRGANRLTDKLTHGGITSKFAGVKNLNQDLIRITTAQKSSGGLDVFLIVESKGPNRFTRKPRPNFTQHRNRSRQKQ
jgi:hypothetical protein